MDKKTRSLVMAKLFLKNKDYKMAESSFIEHLNMNPEDVQALKLLAQVYEQNKRFDKAFEMYERCYLAEPDRTGVLLDICRILLMNEVCLEHVDYRKWLNLAIKAFPSNPVVVNFKAFLSTLPQEAEHTSPKREVDHPFRRTVTSDTALEDILKKLSLVESRLETIGNKKSPDEDLLKKILERLTTVDKRIANVEEKIANLAIAPAQQPVTKSDSPAPFEPPKLNSIQTSPGTTTTNLFEDSLKKMPSWGTTQLFSFPTAQNAQANNQIQPPVTQIQRTTTPTPQLESSKAYQSPFKLGQSPINLAQQPSKGDFSFSFPQPKLDTSTFGSPKLDAPKFDGSIFSAPKFGLASFDSPKLDTSKVGGTAFGSGLSFGALSSGGLKFDTPKLDGRIGEDKKDDENDNNDGDNGVVPTEELAIENTCTMNPIEIKTGEEDEHLLFEHRCKLFRFRDKEYKERGLGSIKVLKHRTTGKGRLIMRREAIGLVCLNCWDCNKIERVRDTQVRWAGLDASDGEPEPTVFLVKFKTVELADTFISHLTDLFSEESSSANNSISSPKPRTENNSTAPKPDVELVDPQLDQSLVDKARKLQLPDLFYHKLKNQDQCGGCNGCEKDD